MQTRRRKYHSPNQQMTAAVEQNSPVSSEKKQQDQSGTNESNVNRDLEELYTNIKSTPNYSAKIKDFLQQYPLHSVNKRITKKIFPRRRTIARYKDELWQADLIEYTTGKFPYHNRGYKYILLVIDVFSKVIYVEALKRKTGDQTADAMDRILQRAESPTMLVTDGGREFFNKYFFKVMYTNNINHFQTPTRTKWKAAVAERANRTIKTRIDRWMQKTGRLDWVSIYQEIVENYNKTPHSTHKMAPLDVTSENRKEVYQRLYPNSMITIECRLKVGDKVRKIREKKQFEKGYTSNWSEEIYTIAAVRQKHAVCWYKLKDATDSELDGVWYYYELNLVARDDSKSSPGES